MEPVVPRLKNSLHLILFAVAISQPDVAGKSIGAVITASHNQEPDNGLKLVDADGGTCVAQKLSMYFLTRLCSCLRVFMQG